MRTEDHPIEYADFEGVIPKGEYGAGNVMVWDRGSWEPQTDVAESLRKGRLTFTLHGSKLGGRWHLVRLRSQGEKRENWLLFKGRDKAASEDEDVLSGQPESVVSGRSLEQIGAARERVWHSKRKQPAAKPARASEIVSRLPVGFRFTNLDKLLYPELGLTKADLIAYYALVAEWLLPHVAGRPLTLVRCPNGVDAHCFYQKHAGSGVPDAVERVEIAEEDGDVQPYMAVSDLPGLLALPQLGALELHTWGVTRRTSSARTSWSSTSIRTRPRLGARGVGRAGAEAAPRGPGTAELREDHRRQGLHVVAPVRRGHSWEVQKASRTRWCGDGREQPRRYTTNARKRCARDACSSTTCATGAAPRRWCRTRRARATARPWPRRWPGASSSAASIRASTPCSACPSGWRR